MKKYYLRIHIYPLFLLSLFIISCNIHPNSESIASDARQSKTNTSIIDTVLQISSKSVRAILEDTNGDFWFGTDGDGVYRYDGKSFTHFTNKDGLGHNQVRTIQEDKAGNIWFGTGGGVSRFDGKTFAPFTNKGSALLSSNTDLDWKIEPDDLWFDAGYKSGVYRYDGHSLHYLQFPKTDLATAYYAQYPNTHISPYGVYSIFKDSKGNVWFGTEYLGVARYDGKSFTWFTEKGLSGSAVRAIFEDKSGNYWFGDSNSGLFHYDARLPDAQGKSLINVAEEKGLGNADFVKALTSKELNLASGMDKESTLASIMTINEDKNGELWIGTFNAGILRYDGKNLTNYTINDGLSSNTIMAIYKDQKGNLWFGTDTGSVYKYN